jgi:hypothetical protein
VKGRRVVIVQPDCLNGVKGWQSGTMGLIEWAKIAVPTLAALVTAVWAVLRWSRERAHEQERKQVRFSALYVNPFLSACQELQSRIYNILCQGGLGPLRRMQVPYPEETVYLMLCYFAWERVLYRHGPYARDRDFLRLTEAIRNTFAADRPFGLDPFCIFRTRQKAISQYGIFCRNGPDGTEFETISFFDFCAGVTPMIPGTGAAPVTGTAPGTGAPSIAPEALQALRAATDAHDLPGQNRLKAIQHLLVELLEYVEGEENVRLVDNPRHLACPGDQPIDGCPCRQCRPPG